MIADSQILSAIQREGSQRKAAAALGLDRRTVERRLARMSKSGAGFRVLHTDIETRPLLAYTWGMFQQNIGPNQVVDWGGVMCFAAEWDDSDESMFHSEWKDHDRMVRAAHRLLDEADAVVGWNSQRFDTRHFNAEFQRAGLRRPTPYRQVDLMRSQKRDAYLPSNKLESRRRWLGKGGKLETGGFQLWLDCMNGDREARKRMEEYNRNDVRVTKEEFQEMRAGGWVRNLPNQSITDGDVCPNCGSDHLQAVRPYTTLTRRYQAWVCQDCGTTSASVKCLPGAARLKAVA